MATTTKTAKAKTVLVTGGAGYIGSHVALELTRSGYQPIIVDNLSSGNQFVIEKLGIPFYIGDIKDEKFLSGVFKKYIPCAVMHFAAHSLVGESVQNPIKYYENNVNGSLALLNSMVKHNVKRLIFSSTAAVYGIPNEIPIKESANPNPINPYGSSKLMVEQMLSDFSNAYELNSVIFRYFNAAGADPEGLIGERHDPETHLVPLAIMAAASGTPLKVFGSDYDTPDGTCIRDYVHVSDISRAHLLGLEALLLGGDGEVYNIGNGDGYSVLDVLSAVENVVGKKIKRSTVERRLGDPPKLVASDSKLKTELGWMAKYPELEMIVETAWKWHRQHL